MPDDASEISDNHASIDQAVLVSQEKNDSTKPLEITDSEFKSFISSSNMPILVDFWAPWCAPCRRLGPTIEQLSTEFAGKAIIAKLDTQKNRNTPQQFGIRGIPTIIIFKDGKEVERLVGLQAKKAYEDALTKHLAVTISL